MRKIQASLHFPLVCPCKLYLQELHSEKIETHISIFLLTCPCSLMDRTRDCGSRNRGSIPRRGTGTGALSSVVERYFDIVEVGGSIPPGRTLQLRFTWAHKHSLCAQRSDKIEIRFPFFPHLGPWYSGNIPPWHGGVRGSTPRGSTKKEGWQNGNAPVLKTGGRKPL